MEEMTNYLKAKAAADKIDNAIISTLKSGKSFRVESGAGSGKTYSLHKVVEWIDKNKSKDLKKAKQHVACITYTNAAVDVIKERIGDSSSVVPMTIHSFAWDNISNYQSILIDGVEELNLLFEDMNIGEVKKVVYDLGSRTLINGVLHLYHDDLIKLFVWMLDKSKFRKILASKYPIILIDEYQDSFKTIMDKFVHYYIEEEAGPQFGLFGDAWQTIYANNGACGLVSSEKLLEIKKESNFRSQKVIVDVLNRIRPGLPQISASDESDGKVVVITTDKHRGPRILKGYYKGELPQETLQQYINNVNDQLKKCGWSQDNHIFMLTHKLLAKQQGYINLLDILANKLKDEEDKYYLFFRDAVEPLHKALMEKNVKQLYNILGTRRQPLKTKGEKLKWKILLDKLEAAKNSSIKDVLKVVIDSEVVPVPPNIVSEFIRYKNGEDIPYEKASMNDLYNTKYSEIVNAISFFSAEGLYSTDHGVKGKEYDSALLVISRGWNDYKFDETLGKNERYLSGNELKEYQRNRNLFYVCCSRPKRNLAIFISVPTGMAFRRYLEQVFGKENMIDYEDFMDMNI